MESSYKKGTTAKLYPSAPLELITDVLESLGKKQREINSFNICIDSFKELNISFQDGNKNLGKV